MRNKKLLRTAKKHLSHARRNIGKAWRVVQGMKLVLARADRLRPPNSLHK